MLRNGKAGQIWRDGPGRREAFRALAGWLAASPVASAFFQQDPFRDHSRVPKLDELINPIEFEAVAYAKLPRAVFDYTAYGSNGEFTLRRNREAFDRVKILGPRMLRGDFTAPRTAVTVLGTEAAFPILISPTAGHQQLHPEGEVATYQGATAASATPMIVSNVASIPFEKIAGTSKGPLWFQLYPKPDAESNRETLERVQAAGAKAIVVTVDQQASNYERALHDRNLNANLPTMRRTGSRGGGAPRNPYRIEETRLWYEWKLFAELRSMIKVPMMAKGILTAEDARLCLEHGLDAVYVSNHGGRSLDYGPSTLEVLPEIADAIGGRVPILLDSGIRRGADILKALALGATAVCLGRIPRWGLGAYGAAGVKRVLEIMQAEFRQAMIEAGHRSLEGIKRDLVKADFSSAWQPSPAPKLSGEPPGRIAPVTELINTLELEPMAQRKLSGALYEEIAGSDRAAFDRITFRPRMMVNTLNLDLTTELFGARLFAPILAGPVADLRRYHAEGEVAWVRGAAAAKTAVVVADRSSVPVAEIAAAAAAAGSTVLWFQAASDAARSRFDAAVAAGCQAVCITPPHLSTAATPRWDWAAIDRIRKGLTVPVLLKGVMTAAETRVAVERGIGGIIVSSYRSAGSSIEALPVVAEAAAGKIPILIDGSFRRGSDVIKAIALGARAALVARPLVWGLAAYGAPGVQQALELLQGEMARDMAMAGRPALGRVDRTLIRLHPR